jgi:hypothetical protein
MIWMGSHEGAKPRRGRKVDPPKIKDLGVFVWDIRGMRGSQPIGLADGVEVHLAKIMDFAPRRPSQTPSYIS